MARWTPTRPPQLLKNDCPHHSTCSQTQRCRSLVGGGSLQAGQVALGGAGVVGGEAAAARTNGARLQLFACCALAEGAVELGPWPALCGALDARNGIVVGGLHREDGGAAAERAGLG